MGVFWGFALSLFLGCHNYLALTVNSVAFLLLLLLQVHYMRDKERGVVWEESIILMGHTVRFVFLSATIPNAAQVCAACYEGLPLSQHTKASIAATPILCPALIFFTVQL